MVVGEEPSNDYQPNNPNYNSMCLGLSNDPNPEQYQGQLIYIIRSTIMTNKVALWHIYKLGRMGFEGTIGYVIAAYEELPPIDGKGKPYRYVLACDVVKVYDD